MTEPSSPLDNSADFSEDPRALVRKFLAIGLFCLIALLTLTTYGIYRIYSWRLVESAHAEAQAVCQVLLVKEKKHLLAFDKAGHARIALKDSDRLFFQRRVQQYLKPYDVDGFRIWDRQGHIVLSDGVEGGTDGAADNPALARVMTGESLTVSENKIPSHRSGSVWAAGAGQVVSYLPVWGRDNDVLGAVEIRRGMEHIRREIRQGVAFSAVVLGTVLLILFGCVYWLVKLGADRLARTQDALRTLATTDPLTGFCNRREILARAGDRFCRRQGDADGQASEKLGVLMLDFDNFKHINDTFGHLVGDRVLRELAGRIRSVLRPYDIVGRFGGEEFLVVLPDSSLEQCREVAERLCREVREKPFAVDGYAINGSISVGGAFAGPCDDDLSALLQRADEGLYRAKNRGKDCATWV